MSRAAQALGLIALGLFAAEAWILLRHVGPAIEGGFLPQMVWWGYSDAALSGLAMQLPFAEVASLYRTALRLDYGFIALVSVFAALCLPRRLWGLVAAYAIADVAENVLITLSVGWAWSLPTTPPASGNWVLFPPMDPPVMADAAWATMAKGGLFVVVAALLVRQWIVQRRAGR